MSSLKILIFLFIFICEPVFAHCIKIRTSILEPVSNALIPKAKVSSFRNDFFQYRRYDPNPFAIGAIKQNIDQILKAAINSDYSIDEAINSVPTPSNISPRSQQEYELYVKGSIEALRVGRVDPEEWKSVVHTHLMAELFGASNFSEASNVASTLVNLKGSINDSDIERFSFYTKTYDAIEKTEDELERNLSVIGFYRKAEAEGYIGDFKYEDGEKRFRDSLGKSVIESINSGNFDNKGFEVVGWWQTDNDVFVKFLENNAADGSEPLIVKFGGAGKPPPNGKGPTEIPAPSPEPFPFWNLEELKKNRKSKERATFGFTNINFEFQPRNIEIMSTRAARNELKAPIKAFLDRESTGNMFLFDIERTPDGGAELIMGPNKSAEIHSQLSSGEIRLSKSDVLKLEEGGALDSTHPLSLMLAAMKNRMATAFSSPVDDTTLPGVRSDDHLIFAMARAYSDARIVRDTYTDQTANKVELLNNINFGKPSDFAAIIDGDNNISRTTAIKNTANNLKKLGVNVIIHTKESVEHDVDNSRVLLITGHEDEAMGDFITDLGKKNAFAGKVIILNVCNTPDGVGAQNQKLTVDLAERMTTDYGAQAVIIHEGEIQSDKIQSFYNDIRKTMTESPDSSLIDQLRKHMKDVDLNPIGSISDASSKFDKEVITYG